MRKFFFVFVLMFVMGITLVGCGTKNNSTDNNIPSGDLENEESKNSITEEMAYEGVNNYCHAMYDWSMAEQNPDIMEVTMGEVTETEYQVIFRSYTGAFVYFYVDKSTGTTKLVEYVPSLDIEEEAGTINLYDYLESDEQ